MGLEPTTSAMARRRSSQLSYVCMYVLRLVMSSTLRSGTSSLRLEESKDLAFRQAQDILYRINPMSNGAGGRVRTGTSKGWSLSALAHLSYPRTTPPNKGEYRKYFMISNFSPQYTQISSSQPARVSFLNWHQSWFWDQWRRLHRAWLHQNW